MEYREFTPHVVLRPFIECYWYARSDRPPFQEQEALIPDGTIELLFNFGEDYLQITDSGHTGISKSHVIGIRRHALFIAQSQHQHFFAIRFKMGGTFPIFGIPAYLFANAFTQVEDLLGKDYLVLENQLFEASTNVERVNLANEFLLTKLKIDTANYTSAKYFLQSAYITEQPSVKHIADAMNLNIKTLERHFKSATGLTPRTYLKIQRFNKAVQLLYAGTCHSLTDVALQAGYYDQAHCIRDFQSLVHQSPKEFIHSQFKIVQVIQPALAARLSKSYNFS